MNFYEYLQTGEDLIESASYLAAKDLIAQGFQVVPITKGKKDPANIKSIYELIKNPINLKNVDFYFKDRDVDIGIIMDYNTEFIDVDPKNKPGSAQAFLAAIQSGWPELYDKLVIDFTPSGGCHVIYKSEVTGGKSAMAKTPSKPNPLTFIERINRHSKQYIKISPSEGYELKQGNPFTIPFLTSEERNFICAIAASFNEIHKPEVKQKEADREDSPWHIFNSTHDWKWVRNELIDRGWKLVDDKPDKVTMLRPGNTPQRYSGIIFKDSNTLYLFTPSTEFENEKPYSPFGVYAMFYHEKDAAAACKQLASEGCGKNIFEEGQFWRREKGRIKIKYTDLLSWYHSIGYRRHNETVVQIINNIVHLIDEASMKRAFISECEFEIQDEMYEKVSSIFNDKGGLMAMLNPLEDRFVHDGADVTWLFFSNIIAKVTPEGVDPVEYKSIDGYIWASDIIPRNYYGTEFNGCDADRFIKILGAERSESLQKIIGYSISRYKDPLNPRAVILMEDIDPETEGESQGGSGKGLCVQFITQFRKCTHFDGKNFRFSDQFLFQNVDPDTSVMVIDDVEKSFKFSSLYAILTGSLLINKKNKQQVIVPFEKSPKIILTSNYAIGGMDASAKRRKYEFPVVKHFGEDLEPISVFKRQFFAGWDRDEWLRFDNFIISCCQKYLADGDKRSIGLITDKSAERSLMANTSREFVEYMDAQLANNFFDYCPNFLKTQTVIMPDGTEITNGVDVFTYLRNIENPDFYFSVKKSAFLEKISKLSNYKHLSTTRLTHWLNYWAKAKGVEMDTSYKRGADTERQYRFIKWDFYFSPNHSDPTLENQVGIGGEEKSEQSEVPF